MAEGDDYSITPPGQTPDPAERPAYSRLLRGDQALEMAHLLGVYWADGSQKTPEEILREAGFASAAEYFDLKLFGADKDAGIHQPFVLANAGPTGRGPTPDER